MQRRIAAESLAAQLFAAEAAIDSALAQVFDFAAAMPRARVEAGLGAEVGQAALERVLESAGGLVSARRDMIAAHAELATVKDAVGLRRVTLVGGGDKSETDVPRTGHLREVAGA